MFLDLLCLPLLSNFILPGNSIWTYLRKRETFGRGDLGVSDDPPTSRCPRWHSVTLPTIRPGEGVSGELRSWVIKVGNVVSGDVTTN